MSANPGDLLPVQGAEELSQLVRRAGHCNGKLLDPPCGYCGSSLQCERCEAIAAQWPLTRDLAKARDEIGRLRAQLAEQHCSSCVSQDTGEQCAGPESR